MALRKPTSHDASGPTTLKQAFLFSIAGSKFIVRSSEEDLKISTPASSFFTPTTVFLVSEESPTSISDIWLRSLVTNYIEEDDVFQLEFLEGVVFVSKGNYAIEVAPSAKVYLEGLGTKWIHSFSLEVQVGYNIKPGPYAVVDGHLREIWKLYSDTNGTLLTALKPETAT
ncbi:hypothetical protein N431DRAFT_483442 [Stipitochalara longipes BDJ]|nr:hypothetical protein N431DRAFT_483442 [Stipitochalara longipes BDJ]